MKPATVLQGRWCTTSSEEWRCRLSERGKGNKMFTAMLQWADPTRATDKSPRSTTVQCFVHMESTLQCFTIVSALEGTRSK